MKLLIASDIHGSATWCRLLMDALDREQPDRVLLLGDLLYHGPRNDLPEGYAPKEVIAMLNPLAPQVIAVRGNCEAEVDQMVLDFPCMADYTVVFDPDATLAPDGSAPALDAKAAHVAPGRELFLTHGHVYGAGFHNSVDHLPRAARRLHPHVRPHAQEGERAGTHAPGRLGVQPRQRLDSQGRNPQLRRLRERRRPLRGAHGGVRASSQGQATCIFMGGPGSKRGAGPSPPNGKLGGTGPQR